MTTSHTTAILTALLLTCSEANLVASHTPSPYSESEHKATQARKRLCSDTTQKVESSVQQASTADSAQITRLQALQNSAKKEKYSRRAQLKALLYELITDLPLDLICLITAYDSHILVGKTQCCLRTRPQATIVTIQYDKNNENIFYSESANGAKYWCNAATGYGNRVNAHKRKKNYIPEPPKLVRSDAFKSKKTVLSDGSIVQENYPEILIIDPQTKKRIFDFVTGLDRVSALCGLPDGRLITGHERGEIKIWV